MTKAKRGAAGVSADHTIDPGTGESLSLQATGIAPDAVVDTSPQATTKYQVHRAFAIPARLDTGKPDYFTAGNQHEVDALVPADRIARYLALGYISETNPTVSAAPEE